MAVSARDSARRTFACSAAPSSAARTCGSRAAGDAANETCPDHTCSGKRRTGHAIQPAGDGRTGPGKQAAAASSPADRTLTVPAQAAGYTQITGSDVDKLLSDLKKQFAKSTPMFSQAATKMRLAVYGVNGSSTPSLIYLGFAKSDSSQLAVMWQMDSNSQALDAFFNGGGVSHTTDYPAGPMGGLLRCGSVTSSGSSLATCAWMDSSVLGVLMEPSGSEAQLAGTTRSFRAAAEK